GPGDEELLHLPADLGVDRRELRGHRFRGQVADALRAVGRIRYAGSAARIDVADVAPLDGHADLRPLTRPPARPRHWAVRVELSVRIEEGLVRIVGVAWVLRTHRASVRIGDEARRGDRPIVGQRVRQEPPDPVREEVGEAGRAEPRVVEVLTGPAD